MCFYINKLLQMIFWETTFFFSYLNQSTLSVDLGGTKNGVRNKQEKLPEVSMLSLTFPGDTSGAWRPPARAKLGGKNPRMLPWCLRSASGRTTWCFSRKPECTPIHLAGISVTGFLSSSTLWPLRVFDCLLNTFFWSWRLYPGFLIIRVYPGIFKI